VREASLFPYVKAWLEAQGCEVFAEVGYPFACLSSMDVVGLPSEGPLLIVQLKTSFSEHLAYQCHTARILSSLVWAAAPTKPRKTSQCWQQAARRDNPTWGFGVLRVHDGTVSELLAPPQNGDGHGAFGYGTKLRTRLESEPEAYRGGVGGVPCVKGVGPAQSVRKDIDAYRKQHPQASRREVFENVPNHYASMESMFSAMSGLRQRLWWAEAREKQ